MYVVGSERACTESSRDPPACFVVFLLPVVDIGAAMCALERHYHLLLPVGVTSAV